jgi:hypothetical protein
VRAFLTGFIQGEGRGQGTLFPVTLEELMVWLSATDSLLAGWKMSAAGTSK